MSNFFTQGVSNKGVKATIFSSSTTDYYAYLKLLVYCCFAIFVCKCLCHSLYILMRRLLWVYFLVKFVTRLHFLCISISIIVIIIILLLLLFATMWWWIKIINKGHPSVSLIDRHQDTFLTVFRVPSCMSRRTCCVCLEYPWFLEWNLRTSPVNANSTTVARLSRVCERNERRPSYDYARQYLARKKRCETLHANYYSSQWQSSVCNQCGYILCDIIFSLWGRGGVTSHPCHSPQNI